VYEHYRRWLIAAAYGTSSVAGSASGGNGSRAAAEQSPPATAPASPTMPGEPWERSQRLQADSLKAAASTSSVESSAAAALLTAVVVVQDGVRGSQNVDPGIDREGALAAAAVCGGREQPPGSYSDCCTAGSGNGSGLTSAGAQTPSPPPPRPRPQPAQDVHPVLDLMAGSAAGATAVVITCG
jgi:hypothetical protein